MHAHVSSIARTLLPVLLLVVVSGCATGQPDDREGAANSTAPRRSIEDAAPGLSLVQVGAFDAPVDAQAVPGTDLVAVVEKSGRVIVVAGMACIAADRCPTEPVTGGDTVVDLRGKVSTGNEQGLLGIAFHPRWPDDPRIFLNFTDLDGATHIEAWTLRTPTGRAVHDHDVLRIRQPYENHNGGHLEFGPDELLYIGTGDGGSGGDPQDHAQVGDELLGKLLRLDVDDVGERGYTIPVGNLTDGAPEVWAVGLRNPWRFSFDSETGDLWIGDVGQDTYEELDAVSRERLTSGGTPNFGWRRFEGFHVFDDSGRVGPGELVKPVLEYSRDQGCSITGGVVYRGRIVKPLIGWYLFADFCKEDLRLLHADGVPGTSYDAGDLSWRSAEGAAQVVSFARIQHGEVLVLSLDGAVRQVVPG